MASRPIWRGQLRLALVSCSVALFAAHHDRANIHFNLINPKTGHRVRTVTRDAETDEDVSRADLVKGYEFKKDHYVIMEPEDFEAARTESSGVIKIEKFIPTTSVDPVYFDSSYYMAPDGKGSDDVYVVLREAIEQSGQAALSRVVMAQRERVVMLTVSGRGLVAHTLYEERELNASEPLFADIPEHVADPDMVKLARQLIERQTGAYDPADFEDQYEKRLRAVIEAKLKGEGIAPEEVESRGDNVVDLMAALRQSLGQTEPEAKPVAKVAEKAVRKRKTS